MKTTYSDMIANLDNLNYVGRYNRPVKMVNSKYEVIDPNYSERAIHTEYGNNEKTALLACRSHYKMLLRKIGRYADEDDEELTRVKDAYIRKTDRDGNVSIIKM